MAERTVSATEARVHFGELLDAVTKRHDVVFVERLGVPAAVVVSIEEWHRHTAQPRDPWDGIAEEMEEHWAYLRDKYGESDAEAFEEAMDLAKEDRDERPLV